MSLKGSSVDLADKKIINEIENRSIETAIANEKK